MPSRERAFPLETLREAARAYAEATSQRRAAREIGLSGTGFRAFLDGTDPHPATVRKLTEWYVRRTDECGGEVSPAAAVAALSLLVAHLPPDERADAARMVAEFVATLEAATGIQPPLWLARIRSQAP